MTADRRATRPPAVPHEHHPRRWPALALAAVLPLLALLILDRLQVPLGCPGRLVYPYSPLSGVRLLRAAWALPPAAALGFGIWLAGRRRTMGLALAAAGALGLVAWTFWAPPAWRHQHIFNALSPAHDGAFVVEALQIRSLSDYLRQFPARAHTPPAEMRGTRVISNPPGTTVLAVLLDRLTRDRPGLGLITPGTLVEAVPPDRAAWVHHAATLGLVLFAALAALWVVALLPLYAVGRCCFAPPVAAAYAAACVFTPATLLFAPGKDAAQLLTVALPLLAWVWALRRRSPVLAALAGALAVLASLVSLVHIWLAAAALLASFWSARRTARPWLGFAIVPAGLAGLAVVALLRLAGVDALATLRAAAAAQATVTRGPDAMPLAWQALGIPLFLLFAGPVAGCLALWRFGSRSAAGPAAEPATTPAPCDAAFGNALLLVTGAILLATVGFTNLETPRLWIPFVPLLLLGLFLSLPPLRSAEARSVALLAALVAAQVAVAALQWSRMDVRESEHRLIDQRFFG